MDINKIIVSALKPIGLEIAEDLYEGDEEEFITFNMADDIGADCGDNKPGTNTIFIQVHYVCPWGKDYAGTRKRIRKALFKAGFTWPEVQEVSDSTDRLRHIVLECAIDNDYDIEEDNDV